MRRIQRASKVGEAVFLLIGLLLVGGSMPVKAETSGAPSLVISQLKITSTSGQFITVYNTSNQTLDMSRYQLEYFNSYDLTKATSSRLISLAGALPPHSYYMINDGTIKLCNQVTIDSVSLGYSSTAGLVEVLAVNQSRVGGSALPSIEDYVSWSKTAVTGAQTLPSSSDGFLVRQPRDSSGAPAVPAAGAGTWQAVLPAADDSCRYTFTGALSELPSIDTPLLQAAEPAATIIGYAAESPLLNPAANVGLMKPLITELLPNPAGSGNDETDEYIELYNPNDAPFDLSGYTLRAGTGVTHSYVFSKGASLAPKSFVAYASSATSLSLSNSGGQVSLIDAAGTVQASTLPYASAKDGQAWALADGKWLWTARPTPGAANIIILPATNGRQSAGKTKAAKSGGNVKAAYTAKTKAGSSKNASTSLSPTAAPVTPIHTRTLAIVAGLALLYAAYEYRSDLANRVYQSRRYLAARRAARKTLAWGRSDRNGQ